MKSEWHNLAFGSRNEFVLWELFHENTKLSRLSVGRPPQEAVKYLAGLLESLPFDGYPTVRLPRRNTSLKMPVGQAMQSRISARDLRSPVVHVEHLAVILHYGYGITRHPPYSSRGLRTVPSAGASFPLEIFVQVRCVRGLNTGLYHYNPQKHHLRLVREGENSNALRQCFAQQVIPANASLLIFITALFERSTFKYGDRGYRFVFLEAGHVAQNINITCAALQLGCLNIGGFFDRQLDTFLQLDGTRHSTIYVVAIGMHSMPGSGKSKHIRRGD